MCRKPFILKREVYILLLIGIFCLSGCKQSDGPSTKTVDNFVDEKFDTHFIEAESTAKDEETLSKPLEVPVNTTTEDIHYHMEDDIDILRSVHRCRSDGENIYLVYGEPDLYIMPIGAYVHSRANIDNPEEMDVCSVATDVDGRIHLLMADSNGDEWFIWRLDEDYQIDKVIDISAYFETKQMPHWFLIDKHGTYYFQWLMSRDGIIVDSEGVLKHRFTLETLGTRWTYEAAVGKDGQIYLVYGQWDEKLEIGEFDVESCSIKKGESSLWFSRDETFSEMSGGTDTNLLLFSPYSGVWACDTEKGVLENRVPLSDIGLGSDTEFCPLTFLSDGRLLLLEWTEKDYYLKYIPVGR